MSEGDGMSVIEHWAIKVCPRCGRVKEASTGCTGAHEDAHPYERTVRVEVVPQASLQGAVDDAKRLRAALEPFLRLDYDIGDEWRDVCESARAAFGEQ